jgi:uncharacterized protein (TIGR00255 family)
MTGYGRGLSGNMKVEVRSFNHKNLDIHVSMPSYLYKYDVPIKKSIRGTLHRGRIEVNVSRSEDSTAKVSINEELAKEYYQALLNLKKELSISGDIGVDILASYRDIFYVEEEDETADIDNALQGAIDELIKMRTEEGKTLMSDISGRLQILQSQITGIEERRDEFVSTAKEQLHERIKEFLEDVAIDESRLVQETAILMEKTDITEEIVRVKSHLKHFEEVLTSGEAIGKKMDFLVQELRRELNTIGSKTRDYEISAHVVEMKHEVEKIKEQVQNIQ